MDDLEQNGRSNCLILHGCVNLPKENAGCVTFENFVLDTLNSRPKFAHPIRNSDIDICYVTPFRKGKNPIIIKFVRSVRNQVSAVTSSFGAPVQTSIMGPHFLVQNVQLGYFLQYRNHCVSLGFFDDSVL